MFATLEKEESRASCGGILGQNVHVSLSKDLIAGVDAGRWVNVTGWMLLMVGVSWWGRLDSERWQRAKL